MQQQIQIPASTSNLGPGFDAIGLALNRYLKVTIAFAPEYVVDVQGPGAESIPRGKDNLLLRVAIRVAERRARDFPTCRIKIENEIPLSRGLGSSGAAIVAGVTCYELMTDDLLTDDEIFQYALEFEPHPDNLAPALYGGLISAAISSEGKVIVARLKVAPGATPIVVIPEFELLTEKARKILPQTYSRSDTVYNIQRAAMTIAALTTGQWSVLHEAMRDRVHQPYRAFLIPGLEDILNLNLPGLWGLAVSGAGPAVFALSEPARADEIGAAISGIFSKYGVSSSPHKLEFDLKGRTITKSL
jgi:homoserine kinase